MGLESAGRRCRRLWLFDVELRSRGTRICAASLGSWRGSRSRRDPCIRKALLGRGLGDRGGVSCQGRDCGSGEGYGVGDGCGWFFIASAFASC